MKTMKNFIKKRASENIGKIIRIFILVVFAMFIILYAISKTRAITEGVKLTVEGIENGKGYSTGILEISGNAKRAKHLLVNGREILINIEGDFHDFLVLSPGYNIITVSAEDRFGKIAKKTFEVEKVKEIENVLSFN